MPKKQKHTGLLGWLARLLMAAAALLLLGSYLSMWIPPARSWWIAVLGLLYIPLVLLNLFLLVWAVARWSRAVVIPLLALLPAAFLAGRYVQFRAPEPTGEPAARIVSYNVGRFAAASRRLGLQDPAVCADSVMAFLRGTGADVICLQEFYLRDPGQVRSYLASRLPGYEAEFFVYPDARGCYGNVTLSRLPMVAKGKIDFAESSNLALWADYDFGGTRLRVYNCHFESYSISPSRLFRMLRGNYREAFRYTEGKLRASLMRRPEQVDRVLGEASAAAFGSIIAGDFNDNPVSLTYRRLLRDRRDTFVEAGRGFGATYRTLWPLLRLDYILHPSAQQALGHQVLRVRYSDHFPIQADIAL